MDNQFSAEAWAKLSVDERIRFCLLMARQVRKLAETADPDEKDGYLDLAGRWETLASEVAAANAN